MRKAALLAASALALPLAVSLPAMAQQSPNAKAPQAGQQQPKAPQGGQQPMQQSNNTGANNQQNGQSAQLSRSQIKRVQQALDQKGFKAGRPDGVLGQKTGEALSKFQKSQNIQQTGQPDDQTLQALGINMNGSTNGSATTGQGTTGQGSNMDQAQPPVNGGNNSKTNGQQK